MEKEKIDEIKKELGKIRISVKIIERLVKGLYW